MGLAGWGLNPEKDCMDLYRAPRRAPGPGLPRCLAHLLRVLSPASPGCLSRMGSHPWVRSERAQREPPARPRPLPPTPTPSHPRDRKAEVIQSFGFRDKGQELGSESLFTAMHFKQL